MRIEKEEKEGKMRNRKNGKICKKLKMRGRRRGITKRRRKTERLKTRK